MIDNTFRKVSYKLQDNSMDYFTLKDQCDELCCAMLALAANDSLSHTVSQAETLVQDQGEDLFVANPTSRIGQTLMNFDGLIERYHRPIGAILSIIVISTLVATGKYKDLLEIMVDLLTQGS